MMNPVFLLLVGSTPSLLPAPAIAPAAATGQRVVVTPEGAFLRADASAQRANAPQAMQSAGTLWTAPDNGLLWIGNAVSIGNHGSEVFSEYDLNNQRAELFSAFDTNPPTALWTDLSAAGSGDAHVASSENGNVHVSLHTFNQGQPGAACILSKYTSLSGGTPDWTYTFPTLANGSKLGISRDGQTIVAAASDPTTSSVDIAVFTPASNVPVSFTNFPLGGASNGVRGFDLSADGSTLYLSAGGTPVNAYIFDIATHTSVFNTPINASFDSHAISGDGSVFAFGNFGTMNLFEKVAGVYTNTYTRTLPGSNYCGYIDISDDGSTVAFGWTFYLNYLPVQIEAVNVATHTVTMSDLVTSSATNLQNIVSGISCSADGEHFAAALWGDGSGPVAEARLYSKHQNAPVATANLNGSVFGLQISADGERAVFGSKSVHANQFGNGGELDLVGIATPFTNFCSGSGSLPTACPCGNTGMLGRGCQNSATTGGALLTAAGNVAPDTVVLTSSNELPHAVSIVLQGNSDLVNGATFGDGVRCVGGTLKRLYIHQAVNGTVVAPVAGDLSITARSATLGDPISSGQTRSYQVYYRDPTVAFCAAPTGDTFNVSNAVRVNW
ncbi:MAG: hypothetical protein IPJ19_18470 [Planctomycetes bacterium]|nr:hypothetical protein [Planctomycetota bacterium]